MTNRYIITLHSDKYITDPKFEQKIESLNGKILQRYSVIPSILVELPDNVINNLKSESFIEDIELDGEMHTLMRPKKNKK